MSWKLSAIVLSPGNDIVDPEHPKRFFSPSAASSSGGMAGQTATVSGVSAASDQGDEEGSEVCEFHHYYCIPIAISVLIDRPFLLHKFLSCMGGIPYSAK
jgi:hypothetical protein